MPKRADRPPDLASLREAIKEEARRRWYKLTGREWNPLHALRFIMGTRLPTRAQRIALELESAINEAIEFYESIDKVQKYFVGRRLRKRRRKHKLSGAAYHVKVRRFARRKRLDNESTRLLLGFVENLIKTVDLKPLKAINAKKDAAPSVSARSLRSKIVAKVDVVQSLTGLSDRPTPATLTLVSLLVGAFPSSIGSEMPTVAQAIRTENNIIRTTIRNREKAASRRRVTVDGSSP